MPRSTSRFAALVSSLAILAACSFDGAGPDAGTRPDVAPATTVPAPTASSDEVLTTTETAPPTTAVPGAAQRYAEPGPYAVGVTTLQLADRPVTVWYPAPAGSQAGQANATYDLRQYLPAAEQAKVADLGAAVFTTDAFADLAAAPGPFPVALFSHGFGGYREQSSFLTSALASWGFVVAAPAHLSRDLTAVIEGRLAGGQTDVEDLQQTLLLLAGENARAGGPLAGRVDLAKVGAVGHSAGGGAVFQLAADPSTNVAAVVGLAPAISSEEPVDTLGKPSLTVGGTADSIIPIERLTAAWASLGGPKRWVTLGGVTHLGFMDTCAQGNVLALAQQASVNVPELLVRLFADGCDASNTDAQQAWPAIRHATIAALRDGLGIDTEPVGLDSSLASAYAPLVVTFQEG